MPVCQVCAKRIMRFTRLQQSEADEIARKNVVALMCMVLARRGLNDGLDAAVLLWNVLEPSK